MGTAFTYQGRLTTAGAPADGMYDFEFKLFDVAGDQVGTTQPSPGVLVVGGVFTVSIDFGAQFSGQRRFLEIGVRTAGAAAPFTVLLPRQELSAVPNAAFALTAGTVVAGGVGAAQIADNSVTAQKLAPGSVVRSLNLQTEAVSIVGAGAAVVTTSAGTLTVDVPVLDRLAALEERLAALEALFPLQPVAPSATRFMWQGQQKHLTRGGGFVCDSRIALGVGDQAVCYGASDGTLRCAGRIHATTFGTSFAPVAGRTNVDQVFVSPTVNSATGNAICVHQADGTAWCMGDYNNWGQFGNGAAGPTASFVQWGGASNLVALATGTWDQMCALDSAGGVYCSGYRYGLVPRLQPPSGVHSKVWVPIFDTAAIDDPGVWRAGESRTVCVVAGSLNCGSNAFGSGSVVSGGTISFFPEEDFPSSPGWACPPGMYGYGPACWLEASGSVACRRCNSAGIMEDRSYFAPGKILALGLNYYGNNLCAVYQDGSLWCAGKNDQGMLGVGHTNPVPSPTMVQPPGSVYTTCQ